MQKQEPFVSLQKTNDLGHLCAAGATDRALTLKLELGQYESKTIDFTTGNK